MQTKRIEYIDALRGFTMFLVVYSHIWTFGYHADSTTSFSHILTNFFLVLFFFISGFVAWKKDYNWNFRNVTSMLKNKFIRLVIPSFFFYLLLCHWLGYKMSFIFIIPAGEYWFTIQLFFFFIFYLFASFLINKMGGVKEDLALVLVALFFFAISYSHVQIERTQFGAEMFHHLGMKNWRYFIFFIVGVLIRKHFDEFVKFTDHRYWLAVFILGFFGMVFYADHISFSWWKPLNMLIYGILSIIVIFTFFRKYQSAFQSSTKLGYVMQYIGKRTMDIYMIHYFLLPRHLDVLGHVFNIHVNPSMEFFITTVISLSVILLSVILGNVIRLSPFLALFLLGDKTK